MQELTVNRTFGSPTTASCGRRRNPPKGNGLNLNGIAHRADLSPSAVNA